MISKTRIRQIHGLERKKNRLEEGLFVAEGPKLVGELLGTAPHTGEASPQHFSMEARYVAATEEWMARHKSLLRHAETDTVTPDELQRISLLQHPQDVVALFAIPHYEGRMADIAQRELTLALDGVQDPGNLGTIVRLADWFGIRHVFCSSDCADVFNPKATQATMGAIARVQLHYVDLIAELSDLSEVPVYGTFLDGTNIYEQQLSHNGVIIMGNEGRGIKKETAALVSHRLLIPPYPADRTTVESLNVAIATAIICAEFRRTI